MQCVDNGYYSGNFNEDMNKSDLRCEEDMTRDDYFLVDNGYNSWGKCSIPSNDNAALLGEQQSFYDPNLNSKQKWNLFRSM